MWTTRPEEPQDADAVRAVVAAAFPTPAEADLVDALRRGPDAWIEGLSTVAEDDEGRVVGHALLTRCHVGDEPALALAPCSVLPDHQRRGVGTAVIRAALDAAQDLGETLVVVLGHPDYYPRFGFTPAAASGVRVSFEVPAGALMVLPLDATRAVPRGTVRYPAAFGV
ncbi:GNAT family N-acetyltransferase [Actinomycetospora atypica]|uniref:GNAT family N-acetyltransferase n=1 Tax=Actinomycetospora atypica TaxID=1290095 RepID=A0ABV9YHN1_9PSEU